MELGAEDFKKEDNTHQIKVSHFLQTNHFIFSQHEISQGRETTNEQYRECTHKIYLSLSLSLSIIHRSTVKWKI
jgi:hypothetical protein